MKSFVYGLLGVIVGAALTWKVFQAQLSEPVPIFRQKSSPAPSPGLSSSESDRLTVLENELNYYRDQYKTLLAKIVEISGQEPPVIPTSEEVWADLQPSILELVLAEIERSRFAPAEQMSFGDITAEYLQETLGISDEQSGQVMNVRRAVYSGYLELIQQQIDGNPVSTSALETALSQLQLAASEEVARFLTPSQFADYVELTGHEMLDLLPEQEQEFPAADVAEIEELPAPAPDANPLNALQRALDQLGNPPVAEGEGLQFERIPVQTGRFNRGGQRR